MFAHMKDAKTQKILLLILLATIVLVVVVGIVRWRSGHESDTNDLTYWREDLRIEEDLRILLEQRLATLRAGMEAYAAEGQEIELDTYAFAAETAWYLGDYGTTREMYEALLDRNAINYVTWNNYGNVLKRMGDTDGALDAYYQALSIMGTEEYYRDYITLLQETYPERDEELRDMLERAVTEIGQTPWLMTSLAEWYLDHDDCDRALSHYDVALDIAEEFAKDSIQDLIDAAEQICE